ncbi:hypothetical protein [Corynebacterium variabile]|uniref:hypothetical protein n=1 Tax=Corynebacterium variabile TaxID=1727 RepID=UPI003FD420A9
MLLQPTEGHIFFAKFDVMKSAAASLEAAYSNRVIAAETEAARQWWVAFAPGHAAGVYPGRGRHRPGRPDAAHPSDA